ncbi:MAG: FtsH protease activity modulator HflK [Rickettsiales bacterium]
MIRLFSKNKSPWGDDVNENSNKNNKEDNNFINFDDIFNKFANKKNFSKKDFNFNSNNNFFSKTTLIFIILIILILTLFSGIYQIKEGEQSIIMRFGKIVRTGNSGLNFAIPGIETVIIAQVDKVRRIEIGYRSEEKDNSKYYLEYTMVTGDENIVIVTADVIYHIDNLEDYVMNVVSPESTIKSVVESSIREATSKINTQAILSDGKYQIMQETKKIAQEILDSYKSGVRIDMIQLLSAEPPSEVIDAYREVQIAKADKERIINDALAYRNQKLPEAQGVAQKIILDAEGFKEKRILDTKGKVARYKVILDAYLQLDNNAKNALKTEIITEAREHLMENTKSFIINNSNSFSHFNLLEKQENNSQNK